MSEDSYKGWYGIVQPCHSAEKVMYIFAPWKCDDFDGLNMEFSRNFCFYRLVNMWGIYAYKNLEILRDQKVKKDTFKFSILKI